MGDGELGRPLLVVLRQMPSRAQDKFLTIREFGAIGNGISFAMGVAAARPDRTVVLFDGDGSLMMHVQELETIKRHRMNILIVVMNDGAYGSELHKLRSEGMSEDGSVFGYCDFAAIARGFGLRARPSRTWMTCRSSFADFAAGGGAAIWDFHVSAKGRVADHSPCASACGQGKEGVSSQYVFLQNVDEEERKRLSHFEAVPRRLYRSAPRPDRNRRRMELPRSRRRARISSKDVVQPGRRFRLGARRGHRSAFPRRLPRNVKVRRHDIETEDLGEALYDLSHCRAMLMWLRDPAKALQRMMLALKPGGWLLAEELDWGFCTVGGRADAGWATEYMHELFKRHEAAGIRHPYFGRTLAAFVAEAGFADLSGELAATIGLDSSAALEVIRLTVRALRAPSISLGESASDLDRLDAVLASPQAIVVGITSIGVQARKPRGK
jgi:hypothetical protein